MHWLVAVVIEINFNICTKPFLVKPLFYKVVLKLWIKYGGKLSLVAVWGTCWCEKRVVLSSEFLLLNRYSDRGHQVDVSGIRLRFPAVGGGYFSCLQYSDRFWGTPRLLSHGYRGLFIRGVKQSGREADRTPTCNAPPRSMISCCGAKSVTGKSNVCGRAVPCVRRFVAGLSPSRLGFDTEPFHVFLCGWQIVPGTGFPSQLHFIMIFHSSTTDAV
jgi:hypothetical protein